MFMQVQRWSVDTALTDVAERVVEPHIAAAVGIEVPKIRHRIALRAHIRDRGVPGPGIEHDSICAIGINHEIEQMIAAIDAIFLAADDRVG